MPTPIWGYATIADLTALRAINSTSRAENPVRAIVSGATSLPTFYYFNPAASGSDDGDGTIAPTTGTGRWIKFTAASSGGGGGGSSGLNTAIGLLPYTPTQSDTGSGEATYANLTDGSFTTGVAVSDATNNPNQFLGADLGSIKTVQRIGLAGGTAGSENITNFLNGSTLEFSDNGTTWYELALISGVTGSAIKQYMFGAFTCRYIRLRAGYNATFDFFVTGACEFRIIG